MFIILINGYNIPFHIKHIHYLDCHLNVTDKCLYTYRQVEHYILSLWSGSYEEMGCLADINIHYMNDKIIYDITNNTSFPDNVLRANQNVFARLRDKFLNNNRYKIIILKLLFQSHSLSDLYYHIYGNKDKIVQY